MHFSEFWKNIGILYPVRNNVKRRNIDFQKEIDELKSKIYELEDEENFFEFT